MYTFAMSTFGWVFIGVPLLVVWVVGMVEVVRRPAPFQAKAAWITVILLLPILGTVLYFALRKPSKEEVEQIQAAGDYARHSDPRAGLGPLPPVD